MAPEAADYPAAWEADVVVSDGGVVHLRPIRPEDADALVAFHAKLSDRTRYLRYFGPYPRMPERDLHRFTHVDHRNRVALVAVLDEEIIGVGRYDRLGSTGTADTADAEVAFVVADAHQGRGIGSILLEHLAAAARERGIKRFVAEVLAENSRMVRVFTDAGYSAKYEYDSGVVHLTFPIAPTEQSRAVAFERERRAEARSIERMLTPRSVAVIGASTDPKKIGHVVFANLMAYGFAGPVYPVHPEARHIGGVRAYPTVLDVPDDVDLAVVAVPAAGVVDVVEQCGHKGVRGVVVMSGGFAERDTADTGQSGAGRELERKSRRRRPRARHARRRSELPRRRQRRPDGAAQRDDRAAGAGPRPGGLLLPVRRPGRRDPRGGEAMGARAVDVRQRRQPGRRQRQRPPAVLGARSRDRRRPALPGELRQPAEVRQAGAAGRAHQAGRGGEDGPVRGRDAGVGGPGRCRCRRSGCRRCSRGPASSGWTR